MPPAPDIILQPPSERHWPRALPDPNPEFAFYWEALRRHEIQLLRCAACRWWVHYPTAACPHCHGTALMPEAITGRGHIYSFSVAHRAFGPGIEPPYAVALIEIEEQPGVRILSNLIDCKPNDIEIGRAVVPRFIDYGDLTMLFFALAGDASECSDTGTPPGGA